ncbi:Uncharacterised protein [uncultured Bacteroides sp.]|nr:Uncharacterised protein [uncultured Bacteroides sp.]
MIDHNHFICHFIFGGHLLNIPTLKIILCHDPEKNVPGHCTALAV